MAACCLQVKIIDQIFSFLIKKKIFLWQSYVLLLNGHWATIQFVIFLWWYYHQHLIITAKVSGVFWWIQEWMSISRLKWELHKGHGDSLWPLKTRFISKHWLLNSMWGQDLGMSAILWWFFNTCKMTSYWSKHFSLVLFIKWVFLVESISQTKRNS